MPDIPLSPPDLRQGHFPTGSFAFLPALQSFPGGKKGWTTRFQSFLLRYQRILCLLDNEMQRFREVWLGENRLHHSSYRPSLVTSGQDMPMMKLAKSIPVLRVKKEEMRAPLCPPPPDRGAEISSLTCCTSSRRCRGASLLRCHCCFPHSPSHCPSPLLAKEGGRGTPRSGGQDSGKTIRKLADSERRVDGTGQATTLTS